MPDTGTLYDSLIPGESVTVSYTGITAVTPNLDREILKLRRKLGDIFDSSGNTISSSPSPPSGSIYVGNSALVATWTAAELLDCYNDAIRIFVDYCLKFLPPEVLGKYIPGFLVLLPNQEVRKTTINSVTYYYINTYTIEPRMYGLLSVKDAQLTTDHSLGAFIPQSEFFVDRIDAVKTRESQLLYTEGYFDGNNALMFLNLTGTAPTVDLLYVKEHTDYIHNSPPDLSGISGPGLRRVLLIAETIAQRYRSAEVRDIADSELNVIMQTDMMKVREN